MTLMDEIRSITREIATLKPRSGRRIALEARLINLKGQTASGRDARREEERSMSLPSYHDRPFGCPLDEADETLVQGVMILWHHGWNTADMARKWCCREAEVYRALQIGLDRRKARP